MRIRQILGKFFTWRRRMALYFTLTTMYILAAWISILSVATASSLNQMLLWFWFQQIAVFIAGAMLGAAFIEWEYSELIQDSERVEEPPHQEGSAK